MTLRIPLQLALSFLLSCSVSFSSQKKPVKKPSGVAPVGAATQARTVTEDEARILVKEIPNVDIAATISRWGLQESELARLRKWADLLVEAPEAPGFQPRWSEFVTQIKTKRLQLQSRDIEALIQMVLSRAYNSANQDLDRARQRAGFYETLGQEAQRNLSDAHKLQGLLRSLPQEPWAGSLLPLPATQRSLRKCQATNAEELKSSCQEVLISTSTELEDLVNQTETRAEEFAKLAMQASSEVDTLSEKRTQTLLALSGTAKMMLETAVNLLGVH